MRPVIDVAADVTPAIGELKRQGVSTVIRYYNHRNSRALPTKCLSKAEAQAISDAGISLGVVFQQRGGAGGKIEDLSEESGQKDASRALELANEIGQPERSAIYFAVDHDYFSEPDLYRIAGYFEAAKQTFNGKFKVGCYGSGTVGGRMKALEFSDHAWLSGSTAWSGTRQMLETDKWSLFQKDLNVPLGTTGYLVDGNTVSPVFPDFGQFHLGDQDRPSPVRVRSPAIMEVAARQGLRLRSGPGLSFDVVRTIPSGTLVEALGEAGEWIRVDLEGDGVADGFMHKNFLRPVSGGLAPSPSDVPSDMPLTPYVVAQQELRRGVVEVVGAHHNPRIVLYHGSTAGGVAADEVPWCSSFVNFCVEQAGLRGTDSKWAMSWHDSGWGIDVTQSPREGDIAVFERRKGSETGEPAGGHVGFWAGEQDGIISLLGGNQSNQVCLASYPKRGSRGGNFYRLLSIRRG